MQFNPTDFLKLAEQLHKDDKYQHVIQAALRTSISRAYYAAFLTVRETIRVKLQDTELIYLFEEVARSGFIHSCIMRIIGRANRYMEKIYGKLFKMRKESDYDLNISITPKDVEEALGIAKKIISLSKELSNSIEVNRISSIVADYYNKLTSRSGRTR